MKDLKNSRVEQASSTSSDSDDMENFIPTKHPTTGKHLKEVSMAILVQTSTCAQRVDFTTSPFVEVLAPSAVRIVHGLGFEVTQTR